MTKSLPTGLLWRNEINTGSLAQKIAPAVKRFIEKYDKVPDIVFIHPATLPEPDKRRLGVVTVQGMRTVSPGYLFVVQDGQE